MVGCVTVCGIAFGITGINPNVRGRTFYDWELIRIMLIHGVGHGWVDGQ